MADFCLATRDRDWAKALSHDLPQAWALDADPPSLQIGREVPDQWGQRRREEISLDVVKGFPPNVSILCILGIFRRVQ